MPQNTNQSAEIENQQSIPAPQQFAEIREKKTIILFKDKICCIFQGKYPNGVHNTEGDVRDDIRSMLSEDKNIKYLSYGYMYSNKGNVSLSNVSLSFPIDGDTPERLNKFVNYRLITQEDADKVNNVLMQCSEASEPSALNNSNISGGASASNLSGGASANITPVSQSDSLSRRQNDNTPSMGMN